MSQFDTNRAARRNRPLVLDERLKTPGQRHNWTLAHLCASNPKRNLERWNFRAFRLAKVRVRRPSDLKRMR